MRDPVASRGVDSRFLPSVHYRALTLWQPWASFVAWGFKTIETRSWAFRPPPGEQKVRIAIHAAKTDRYDMLLHPLWERAGIPGAPPALSSLVHGSIIAVVTLQGCGPTEAARPGTRDVALGDFTKGRFAWYFDEIDELIYPVPCRGRQGLFVLNLAELEDACGTEFRRVSP